MFKTFFIKATLIVAFAFSWHATASANIVLDLDLNEGDQGLMSQPIQPGDVVEIELIAQQGAQDIAGFEVAIKFDSEQFIFKSYQKGGLMASAIPLPAAPTAEGVKISAGFLGGKSAEDSGSLGTLIFEASPNLTTGGSIMLTQGSFGADGQTMQFALNSEVRLEGPQAQLGSSQVGPDGLISDMGGQLGMVPPVALIKNLPPSLQGIYLETHRRHLQAELEGLIGSRQTLSMTQQYLPLAKPQEIESIGKVLLTFHHTLHGPGPYEPLPPMQINDLIAMMMQHVEEKIQKLQQELNSF